MSTLNEGDEIIIPEPFYANYTAFALMVGAKIKTVTAKIEDNFALPPMSEFEKQITPKTDTLSIFPQRDGRAGEDCKKTRIIPIF